MKHEMPDMAGQDYAPRPELLGKFTPQRSKTRPIRSDRRGSVMVEFAMVGPVFFLMLFFVFEIAYDQFLQSVLESSLAATARQMQIGATQTQPNSSTLTTYKTFTPQYFCPNSFGFLNCANLYVRVETLKTTFPAGCKDVYQATTGTIPSSGTSPITLLLGSFSSQNGSGLGANIANSACDAGAGQGFCSPGGNEFVLVTAVYLAPSFLGGLLPNTQIYKYNGNDVRAQYAASAFQTENFTTVPNNPSGC